MVTNEMAAAVLPMENVQGVAAQQEVPAEGVPQEPVIPRRRRTRRERAVLGVKYAVSVLLILFFLFPYMYMLFTSVMTAGETSSIIVHFFPQNFQIENYKIVVDYLPNLGNTLVVLVINCIFQPLSACFCAFPLARHRFIGKKFVFMLVMSTVMVPGIVLQIPTYIMYSAMGLINTLASQWIQAFFGGGALSIFLVIQFMRTLPRELDEAATIDGANQFQIFFVMILPNVMNVFLYLSISLFIGLWMDFQNPLIYLQVPEKYTLALAFYADFSNTSSAIDRTNELCAMAVCMTIPPIIVFLLFQKTMIGGIKIGGIKG